MMRLLQQSLMQQESDLLSLLALSGIALLVLLPLALMRPSYVFSQGYGLSVATCAMALIIAFDGPLTLHRPEILLGLTTTIYGLRLSLFLFYRGMTVPNMKEQAGSFDKNISTSKLLMLTGILSLLYSSMTSPLLYAMKHPLGMDGPAIVVAQVGITLSFFGVLLESIADHHKYYVKHCHSITYGERNFVGPTGGLYAFCRHPNFSGEILFWTGLFVAGLPCYHKSWTAWTSSLAGWMTIVSIMKFSSDRLDKKQDEWYHDQPPYMEWKKHVVGAIIPFCKVT